MSWPLLVLQTSWGHPILLRFKKKKQSIKIWLHHLKVSQIPSLSFTLLMPHSLITNSSAKSLHSSPQSTVSTSSLSKAIRCGVKHIKKGASAITHPLKWAKHVLSTIFSPVVSDQGDINGDQDSMNSQEVLEVININSDGKDSNKLERELGTHTSLSLFITLLISIFILPWTRL